MLFYLLSQFDGCTLLGSPSKHSKPLSLRAHVHTDICTKKEIYIYIYIFARSMQLPECVSDWWQCHQCGWGILAPAGAADIAVAVGVSNSAENKGWETH